MASAASTSAAAVAAVASRVLLLRRSPRLLRRLPAALSARPSSSSSSFGAVPLRRPLGHLARMGHTSTAAAASAAPALGLTKPNAVEPPQIQPPLLLRAVASSRSGSSARLSFRWRRAGVRIRAGAGGGGRRESPYEVLGVPPSAAPGEIKRAYRRLALKYHPDVNKEANVQEKFLRIKHAYNTLMNSESRSKYASSNPDSSWTSGSSKSADAEEQFYGFADFLKDLQSEFQNWEAVLNSEQKPKSLREELGAIGEEFVEFLENELKIDDSSPEDDSGDDPYTQFGGRGKNAPGDNTGTNSSDDGVSDIEAILEQLKKELGLS